MSSCLFSKLRSLVLTAMTLSTLMVSIRPALSQSQSVSDWQIVIETQRYADKLNYAGSELTNLTRIVIYAGPIAERPRLFQMMWYRGGIPLGIHRSSSLDIPQTSAVHVAVLPRLDARRLVDQQAAAHAVLQILLETYSRGRIMANVVVPSSFFANIQNELEMKSFRTGAQASALSIALESENGSATQTLFYAP